MTTMKDKARKILEVLKDNGYPEVDGRGLNETLYTLSEGGLMPDEVSVSNEQALLMWACVEYCRIDVDDVGTDL